MFQLLTETKGKAVRVQKIAQLIDRNGNYTRVNLTKLSKRLQENPKIAPNIDVISTNEGSYKIAVKSTILNS